MRIAKNIFTASLAIAGVLLVNSCKLGKDLDPVDLDLEKSFVEDTITTDTAEVLEWWTMFDDPILDSMIIKGLANNKNMLATAQRIEQARFRVGIQKGEYGPKFNLSGAASTGTFLGIIVRDEPVDNFFTGTAVNWELDFWGKFRRMTEAARADLMAEEYGYRSVQLSLITDIASTYFSILGLDSSLSVAERTVEIRKEYTQIIQARFEAGTVPEIDLNQAQIQLAIAQAAVPAIHRQLTTYEYALSLLLGETPTPLLYHKPLEEQPSDISIPVGMPAEVIAARPDVQQAWNNALSANAYIGVAQAYRFPAISITGTLGLASNDLSNLNAGSLGWNAGASLLGPLFHWNQNLRRVDIERSKTEAAVLQYEQTVLNALYEVEISLVTIETLKEEKKARELHTQAAKNAEFLSKNRYDRGVTSYLEYLESQRQAFDAQLALIGIETDLLISYIRLYKSLGGGWITPEEKANSLQPEDQ